MISRRAARVASPGFKRLTLAAIVLVAGTSSAVFAEETSTGTTVLRGTPPRTQEPQAPQQVQITRPPPLPACPEGFYYSILTGFCYRPGDPTKAGEIR